MSITTRAFNDAALRPNPWPMSKGNEIREMQGKDGRRKPRGFETVTQRFSRALLKFTGALYQSIRLVVPSFPT